MEKAYETTYRYVNAYVEMETARRAAAALFNTEGEASGHLRAAELNGFALRRAPHQLGHVKLRGPAGDPAMATLEEILDEARKLPAEEQRRLRDALDALTSNGDAEASYRTHEGERDWIEEHRDEFLDQWVALDGDHLIAHGTDARGVYEEARARGITVPYLVHVTPKAGAYVGGW